jgi:hypothetical protein
VKPIEFPQQTQVWAKDQPPYLPLPAYVDLEESVSLWTLTWRERLLLLFRGRLWLRQCNFGRPLQPVSMTVDDPFVRAA